MNEILLFLVYKYKGDWNLVYKAIKNKEEIKEEEFNLFLNEKFKKEKNFITILDEQYPKKLLNIKQPPFVLFYKGNLNLLNIQEEFIYLTGSYETKSINEYINSLKNKDNITFINLFWNGLERKILKRLIKNKSKIVILLPCGIEWGIKNLNLAEFESENCLFISEYPDEYHCTKNSFIARNRINACFSKKLILLSSLDKKFNGVINEFLDQGKDIECLLFNDHLNNDQNIDLINEGATLINKNLEIC